VAEEHMRGQTYRLKTCTLAMLDQDGHKVPMTIPSGGTVEKFEDDVDGN